MSKYAWRGLMILAMLMVLVNGAIAQTVTGTIQGTATDTSGAVLPGVTITVKHTETGAERVVVTNEAGFYSAPFIAIGRYEVGALLSGFGAVKKDGIQLGLNETRVVDFTLDPRVTEAVTVRGDAPAINLTSGEVKGTLTAEQIMDKPTLAAGSFLTLAETFTGFQENPTGGQNNPTTSSGSSINFNGTGTRGATFQINGVNNDDSSENQNRQGAALSTIQEFQVLKNGYSAEFGRGDGAVVLVQTKSGTNRLRGDAYIYQQDSDWNARTFFAVPGSPKPVAQRSQYRLHRRLPDHRQQAVRLRQRRSHQVRRRERLHPRRVSAERDRAALAHSRQRYAREPRVDPEHPRPLPVVDGAERSPVDPDVHRHSEFRLSGPGLLRPARPESHQQSHPYQSIPVDPPASRSQGRGHRRDRAAGQQAAEPRHHLDARARVGHGRRAPLRSRAALDQREYQRRERHTDRAVHRHADYR